MVGAKQLETRDFILVPAGAVRPAVACSRHYIALHRGACSGAATSEAGEERGLQVPSGVIGAIANIAEGGACVQCVS
jgi:hypothetical protein